MEIFCTDGISEGRFSHVLSQGSFHSVCFSSRSNRCWIRRASSNPRLVSIMLTWHLLSGTLFYRSLPGIENVPQDNIDGCGQAPSHSVFLPSTVTNSSEFFFAAYFQKNKRIEVVTVRRELLLIGASPTQRNLIFISKAMEASSARAGLPTILWVTNLVPALFWWYMEFRYFTT